MPRTLQTSPGVVISVQSYGDRLNLHPHVHALASRGVWSSGGNFEAIPALDAPQLMPLFRHHMFKNPLACGRIGQATLDILNRFHHPDFPANEGEGVAAGDSAPGGAFSGFGTGGGVRTLFPVSLKPHSCRVFSATRGQ